MKNNNLIKSIVFIVIFMSIFFGISKVFVKKDTYSTIDLFYNEQKNTHDVLFIGSSHMFNAINTSVLWREYGIPSYVLGSPGQDIALSYAYLKEALKTQKPKVVVLDVFAIAYENTYFDLLGHELNIQISYDKMKLSTNKVLSVIKLKEIGWDSKINYIFNLFRYKTRWKELTENDFKMNSKEIHSAKGSSTHYGTNVINREQFDIESTHDFNSNTKNIIYKIIKLCEENDIEICLIKTPYQLNDIEFMQYNKLENIAKEEGIEFINYNKILDDIEFNNEEDFIDKGHVNFRGSEKLTSHIGKFLVSKYGLINKTGESAYIEWEKNAESYYNRENIK